MWYIQVEFYQFLTRPSCTVSLVFFVKSSSPFISSVLALKQGDSHYKKMDGQSLTESIVRTLHDIEAAQAFSTL